MQIKKYIPNTITCFNLVSGCISIVMALQGNLLMATVWIIIAAVFDFFDGFAARILKSYSPMGKELDSLADVVSFGVAPGMILFYLLGQAAPSLPLGGLNAFVPYLAFIIPAFSGLRLAKFNIDVRQTDSFIGLNVPSNALFWSSLGYSVQPFVLQRPQLFTVVAILLAIGTSLLLVSEIPMFSLKIKSLSWKGNEYRYILLVSSIVFVVLWGFLGITGAIVLYVVLSLLNKK